MQPTVAIIGASADRSKFGNRSIHAHLNQGFDVYPVNPKGGTIEGLRVYETIEDVPVELNRISMYVPPHVGCALLDAIVRKGCDELWLNPGSDSEELVEQARAAGLNPVVACSIVALGENPHQ